MAKSANDTTITSAYDGLLRLCPSLLAADNEWREAKPHMTRVRGA